MKDDEFMLLVMLAGAAMSRSIDWGDGWVWPVPPVLIGGHTYRPVISDGWGSSRGDRTHRGVDIMYERRSQGDVPQYKPGTSDGTRNYFAPRLTPILAAREGRIWQVTKTERGWAIVLDHGRPWATFYQHIETPSVLVHEKGVNVATGTATRVAAGQPIGFMGYSPLDGQKLRHLHFETWYKGGASNAVDPAGRMTSWALSAPWRP